MILCQEFGVPFDHFVNSFPFLEISYVLGLFRFCEILEFSLWFTSILFYFVICFSFLYLMLTLYIIGNSLFYKEWMLAVKDFSFIDCKWTFFIVLPCTLYEVSK